MLNTVQLNLNEFHMVLPPLNILESLGPQPQHRPPPSPHPFLSTERRSSRLPGGPTALRPHGAGGRRPRTKSPDRHTSILLTHELWMARGEFWMGWMGWILVAKVLGDLAKVANLLMVGCDFVKEPPNSQNSPALNKQDFWELPSRQGDILPQLCADSDACCRW